MTELVKGARGVAEGADREALKHEEEAIEVASQWAQEKLENFLLEVESVFLFWTMDMDLGS
jgi:phosphoribosyl-ATP pyrophosphohydrolase